jgi:hypothetical protein
LLSLCLNAQDRFKEKRNNLLKGWLIPNINSQKYADF